MEHLERMLEQLLKPSDCQILRGCLLLPMCFLSWPLHLYTMVLTGSNCLVLCSHCIAACSCRDSFYTVSCSACLHHSCKVLSQCPDTAHCQCISKLHGICITLVLTGHKMVCMNAISMAPDSYNCFCCQALAVLHGCGLAHVNLKCNKVLCKRLSDGSMHCRITDLGSALREGNDACMPPQACMSYYSTAVLQYNIQN